MTPVCLLFLMSFLETVTELCNVACSSVMPGGGTNLELALHCLHEAQGNVQVRHSKGTLPAFLGPRVLGACDMCLLRGSERMEAGRRPPILLHSGFEIAVVLVHGL